jgi:CheY-like chemotaxis protein
VLESLRSMLRKHRHEWEMTFASDGEAALLELQRAPFEVVVTDMRMPRMDGATLLRRIIEDHPQVVRIVLSGRTELAASRRSWCSTLACARPRLGPVRASIWRRFRNMAC